MPLSTTSHRTLRDLQQWQAFDALLLTFRPLAVEIPAADCFLLLLAG
jgi:hypothetical protein